MRTNHVTNTAITEAGSEPPSDDAEVCGAAARVKEPCLLQRLATEVGIEANLRRSDLIEGILVQHAYHHVVIEHGFTVNLGNGNEYNFCPGESYTIKILREFSESWWLVGQLVRVCYIEVICKNTMSHEQPPAGLKIYVRKNALMFVTEDE